MSRATAPARAALAGNPSDGYGGAVLAVTLPAWRAEAETQVNAAAGVEPPNALVQTTVDHFARELEPAAAGTSVRWTTSIPQRVGLGSSSALVIAVTRALSAEHEVDLDPVRLAEFALAVETEGLGIVAGLQDRVAQAYGGLTFMDFAEPRRYERLEPTLLPPLIIAWRETAAADSGGVHAELQRRHVDGDRTVRGTMAELARAARESREALLEGDLDRFRACVDATFDLRHRLMDLDPRCVEMIQVARAGGAAANYTGSGGAIVAVCRGHRHADEVERRLAELGCGVMRTE
jgi:glucuronokinase